ncbi:MAG: hypothetical protein IJ736_08500, partial [Firmicutes bacterium]|nr:hypothetical protein [Bacillota bacterium]
YAVSDPFESESVSENKSDKNKVSLTIGSQSVNVGGKVFEIPAAPFIQNDTNSTLVPLRFAAIAVSGADVSDSDSSDAISWDADTKTATVNADGKSIRFTAGSDMMRINGSETAMDNSAKAEIKDGRIYIPFRVLGTALGVGVQWDAQTKTASYSMVE